MTAVCLGLGLVVDIILRRAEFCRCRAGMVKVTATSVVRKSKGTLKGKDPCPPVVTLSDDRPSSISKAAVKIFAWLGLAMAVKRGVASAGVLTVGSACSGWGSELMALDRLGIKYDARFAAEIDPSVRALGVTFMGLVFFRYRWNF